MDDNSNSDLEEMKIDRQLRARVEAARNGPAYSYERSGDNGSSGKRFLDPLILAAIIALVGAVWVLGINVAQLQTSVGFLKERTAEIRGDVRELQGKQFRGVDGYGEPGEKDAGK